MDTQDAQGSLAAGVYLSTDTLTCHEKDLSWLYKRRQLFTHLRLAASNRHCRADA